MNTSSTPELREDETEISLLDLLITLAKRKRLLIGLPLACAAFAAAISLSITPLFIASASILPPQQAQSSATAMLAQAFGGAGGIAGSALGIKNPSDIYIAMLQSRAIATTMIARYDLKNYYQQETLDDTVKVLASNASMKSGKDGIITISVTDKDPKIAAQMANDYVKALDTLARKLAIGEAARRRLFFEQQLKDAQAELAQAEEQLKSTQEKTGLIQLDTQAKAAIGAVAELRAQIAAREVALAGMRSYATEKNPEYIRTQRELDKLKTNLRELETRSGQGGGDVRVSTRSVPKAGLINVRQLREVKYRETLYELLAKQYEVARLDEARDAPLIQVLDPATPPERKSKPKRTLMVLLATTAGGFVAIFLAFILEGMERQRQDPNQAARLALLRQYWRGKPTPEPH